MRRLDLREDPSADLTEVVEHVHAGGLVAYPTETVYGLGGPCTPAGVELVRAAKLRDEAKPLIALVESAEVVSRLSWTDAARELAEIFWPGSLTLVLEDPEGIFPPGVRDVQTGTVGVRVSPHPVAARLVQAMGAPLTSTSLNLAGEPPALSGTEAAAVIDHLGAGDVWLLDTGTLLASEPSTVVDCSGPEPLVLRRGAVPVGRLRCAIPDIDG